MAEADSEALTPGPRSDFTPAMNAVLPRRRSPAWTLANCLTYGRLVAVPVMVALLFWPESHTARWTALGVFVAAAITDYLDGYVARTYHQSSALGRMLDPIADKLLVSACLLMLAAVLATATRVLANDSGAMHLAAALGTPVVAVFGPTREHVTAPLGPHTILTHEVWCRPCMLRECPLDHACMTRVTPARVLAALRDR